MTISLDIGAFVAMMSIPSAVTAFCFWLLQKSLSKRDVERDKREEARKVNEMLVIKGVGAAISLGEATAKSVQRLDPACNGEMKSALEYARKVKHEQKDFLSAQGIANLY